MSAARCARRGFLTSAGIHSTEVTLLHSPIDSVLHFVAAATNAARYRLAEDLKDLPSVWMHSTTEHSSAPLWKRGKSSAVNSNPRCNWGGGGGAEIGITLRSVPRSNYLALNPPSPSATVLDHGMSPVVIQKYGEILLHHRILFRVMLVERKHQTFTAFGTQPYRASERLFTIRLASL